MVLILQSGAITPLHKKRVQRANVFKGTQVKPKKVGKYVENVMKLFKNVHLRDAGDAIHNPASGVTLSTDSHAKKRSNCPKKDCEQERWR